MNETPFKGELEQAYSSRLRSIVPWIDEQDSRGLEIGYVSGHDMEAVPKGGSGKTDFRDCYNAKSEAKGDSKGWRAATFTTPV